jgi:cytoskeletal protein RodZ
MTIHQVADATKMRTDHVRALEEGNYDVFTAPVYIRGFARTYAALLKLDVAQFMLTVDAELASTEKFREPPSLTREPPGPLDQIMLRLSRINWRIALPITGVVVVGLASFLIVRAWQGHRARDPLAGVGPGLYQAPQKPAGEVLPLPAPTPPRK